MRKVNLVCFSVLSLCNSYVSSIYLLSLVTCLLLLLVFHVLLSSLLYFDFSYQSNAFNIQIGHFQIFVTFNVLYFKRVIGFISKMLGFSCEQGYLKSCIAGKFFRPNLRDCMLSYILNIGCVHGGKGGRSKNIHFYKYFTSNKKL